MKTRQNSRAIILNDKNELFLFKFEFAMLSEHKTLWVSPGGGLENGETFEMALERELFEELGITINTKCLPLVFQRHKPFITKNGDKFISEEKYFLVKVKDISVSFKNFTETENKLTKDYKWWTPDEIKESQEEFFAENLYDLISNIIAGILPKNPIEI
jgi:8-oxo-dGTP pyrophosphatase MutT (NUDIX family)